MTKKQTIKVLGIPQLMKRLAVAEGLGRAAVLAGQAELAQKVAQRARELAPVDTGTLAESITNNSTTAYTTLEYAPYVEYGSMHDGFQIPPQPFMRPAADEISGKSEALTVAPAILRRI